MQLFHARKSFLPVFKTIISVLLILLILSIIPITKPTRAVLSHPTTPINHAIFIMMENHTFNDMFGTFPGAIGTKEPPAANPLPSDFDHERSSLLAAMDGGKMDEFPPYTKVQYSQQDIPTYWSYAQHFGLGDNFFTTEATSSTPNHVAMVSAGQITIGNSSFHTGCSSPPYWLTISLHTSGQQYYTYPCYDITNIPTSLTAHNLSWKYYVQGTNSIWDPSVIIKNLYNNPNVIHNPYQIVSDIRSQALSAVSWVAPTTGGDDHPPLPFQPGENFVSHIVNTVMDPNNIDPQTGQPYWQDTAVFVTWDDWGSFYDPVPPPQIDGAGDGPRAPLLVISALARPGYISHQLGDFSSFDKFIETNWNLPSLGFRDNNPSISNLMDYFNFSQQPQPPLIIQPIPFPNSIRVPTWGFLKGGPIFEGALSPIMGGPNRPYTYRVIWALGHRPKLHNLIIDGGTPIPMTDAGHVAGQGELYTYSTKLSVGAHNFSFTFSDTGPNSTMTLPYNIPFTGPLVYPFSVAASVQSKITRLHSPVTYSLFYTSPANKAPVTAELDIDGISVPLTRHGSNYQKGVKYTYTTSSLALGEHYYRALFDDGSGLATYQGTETPIILPFTFSHSSVQPPSGTPSTPFIFQTTYVNANGLAPSTAQVYVDDSAHPMSLFSGSPAHGVYQSQPIKLPSGNHSYVFVFSDSYTSWHDPKSNGTYSGPSVSIHGSPPPANTNNAGTIIIPSHDLNPDFPYDYSPIDIPNDNGNFTLLEILSGSTGGEGDN